MITAYSYAVIFRAQMQHFVFSSSNASAILLPRAPLPSHLCVCTQVSFWYIVNLFNVGWNTARAFYFQKPNKNKTKQRMRVLNSNPLPIDANWCQRYTHWMQQRIFLNLQHHDNTTTRTLTIRNGSYLTFCSFVQAVVDGCCRKPLARKRYFANRSRHQHVFFDLCLPASSSRSTNPSRRHQTPAPTGIYIFYYFIFYSTYLSIYYEIFMYFIKYGLLLL